MPSLPASDGFRNPVQSSGLSSKICNPTNQLLDCSVPAPASTCSSESSLTESIDPRAVKSCESSAECRITPEKEDPLLLQHLSSNSFLSNNDRSLQMGEVNCCSPACLSQKTLEETFVADSLMECNTIEQGCGEEPPLEVTTENSLTDTATKVGQIKDAFLSSEHEEQKQNNEFAIDHQMCKETGKFEHLKKQTGTTDPESPPGSVGGIENPVVEDKGCTASQPENPPAEVREDMLEKTDLSCVKGSIQMSASCSCIHMELDVVEHSVAEMHSSASKQKLQAENGRASDLSSDDSSMEVESLKSATSFGDPVSTSDVLQSKSTSAIPAKCNELSNLTGENSSSPSSIHQPEMDLGRPLDETCFSLASALKELHKLLIINCQGECKLLASEVSQLEVVHKGQAQQKGISEDVQKASDPDSHEQSCSSFKVRSEGRKAEGIQPCDSGTESVSPESVGHMESALGEDALEIQKFSGKSDSIVVTSAADQQQSSEQMEILAEWFHSPTSDQNTSVSSQPALDEDAPQDTQVSFTGAPGRSSSSAPEGPESLAECEEPLLSPPVESSELPLIALPPAFPAADVDRILGAGFTTQEALEALEQADGNADLALLILLAKSIVVPT
ncbi:RSCA1 protein, partial [Penelope pileata]|nr:RSCA1 protein [Penelope pileata]